MGCMVRTEVVDGVTGVAEMTDNPHYVTLEEAGKMGCPMSMGRDEFAASCIGKTCMAWRWKQIKDLSGNFIKKTSTTHGYCGMVQS